MHKNFATVFANTVVLTNAEHVAVTNPVWDRPWFTNEQPTQLAGAGSAGQLSRLQFDAPSFYLHNKGVYYHCDQDTPDKCRRVP